MTSVFNNVNSQVWNIIFNIDTLTNLRLWAKLKEEKN